MRHGILTQILMVLVLLLISHKVKSQQFKQISNNFYQLNVIQMSGSDILNLITQNSEYTIAYAKEQNDKMSTPITINMNGNINEILKAVLQPYDIEYVMKDKQIVLEYKDNINKNISNTNSTENTASRESTNYQKQNDNQQKVDDGLTATDATNRKIDIEDQDTASGRKQLEEVVVIGYGTQKKSSMTASVASVPIGEINKQVAGDVASTLQGRVAGVDVLQRGGAPGSTPSIVIRGAASFSGTDPLYIIDGVFSNNGLQSLNANDIESIEILKDASAASIYGSRAANGVIIVTTKSGQKGKPIININASYSFETPFNMPKFLDANQWRSFAQMVAQNSGLAPAPEDVNPTNPAVNTNWSKAWLQYAPIYNVNASISGGSEHVNYAVSAGYFDQKGVTIFSGFKKYNIRENTTYKKGIFTLSQQLGVTYSKTLPTNSMVINLPTIPMHDANGNFFSGGPNYYINPAWGNTKANPIAPLYYTDRYTTVADVLGGLTASLNLYKGLVFRTSFSGNYSSNHSYNHVSQHSSQYNPDGTPNYNFGSPYNSLSEGMTYNFNYTVDNILSYNTSIHKNNIDVLLGTSWNMTYNRGIGITTIPDANNTELAAPNITVVADGTTGHISSSEANYSLLSFFGRINYDYDDRYLASVSLRSDESSKFAKGNRVGIFPSGSIGWNIHRESFFQPFIDIVSQLKIRGSYGQLGSNFLSPYNFDNIAFGPIPYILNGIRYTDARGAYLKTQSLTWETATTWDIGIDLGFLHNDITITVDYYNKKNTNLLAPIFLNPSSGQIFEVNTSNQTPYVNTAFVQNQGFEFLVAYKKQITKDVSINVSANLTTLNNKVLALGDNVQPITAGAYSSSFNDAPSITKPGYAIGSLYGYQVQGFDNKGNFMFKDNTGDGTITADDKVILGNPIPKFTYGINIGATLWGFDITLFFQGVSGNKIFNAQKYNEYFVYSRDVVTDVLNSWDYNKNTNIPTMNVNNATGGNALPSDWYVENGSYLRLKNLQIGYTLNNKINKKLQIKKWRFFIGVQNVFTITNYKGYDPEINNNALFTRGLDMNATPNTRTYTVGTNITF